MNKIVATLTVVLLIIGAIALSPQVTYASSGGNGKGTGSSVGSCLNGHPTSGSQCKNPQPTHCNKNNPQGKGCPASGGTGPVCGNGFHTHNPHCATPPPVPTPTRVRPSPTPVTHPTLTPTPVRSHPTPTPVHPGPTATPGHPRPTATPGHPKPTAIPGHPRPTATPVLPHPTLTAIIGGPTPVPTAGGPTPTPTTVTVAPGPHKTPITTVPPTSPSSPVPPSSAVPPIRQMPQTGGAAGNTGGNPLIPLGGIGLTLLAIGLVLRRLI